MGVARKLQWAGGSVVSNDDGAALVVGDGQPATQRAEVELPRSAIAKWFKVCDNENSAQILPASWTIHSKQPPRVLD